MKNRIGYIKYWIAYMLYYRWIPLYTEASVVITGRRGKLYIEIKYK